MSERAYLSSEPPIDPAEIRTLARDLRTVARTMRQGLPENELAKGIAIGMECSADAYVQLSAVGKVEHVVIKDLDHSVWRKPDDAM